MGDKCREGQIKDGYKECENEKKIFRGQLFLRSNFYDIRKTCTKTKFSKLKRNNM